MRRARDRKRRLGTQEGRKNEREAKTRPLNRDQRAETRQTTGSAASSRAPHELILADLPVEDRDHKAPGANRTLSFEKVLALTSTMFLVAAFSATPAVLVLSHALQANSAATYFDPEEPLKGRDCQDYHAGISSTSESDAEMPGLQSEQARHDEKRPRRNDPVRTLSPDRYLQSAGDTMRSAPVAEEGTRPEVGSTFHHLTERKL